MSSELGQDCKKLHEIDDMQVSVKMFVLSQLPGEEHHQEAGDVADLGLGLRVRVSDWRGRVVGRVEWRSSSRALITSPVSS